MTNIIPYNEIYEILLNFLLLPNNTKWLTICHPNYKPTTLPFISLQEYIDLQNTPTTLKTIKDTNKKLEEEIKVNIISSINQIKSNPITYKQFYYMIGNIFNLTISTTNFSNYPTVFTTQDLLQYFEFANTSLEQLKFSYSVGNFGNVFTALQSAIRDEDEYKNRVKVFQKEKLDIGELFFVYLYLIFENTTNPTKKIPFYSIYIEKILTNLSQDTIQKYQKIFNMTTTFDGIFEASTINELNNIISSYNNTLDGMQESSIAIKKILEYCFLLNFKEMLINEINGLYYGVKEKILGKQICTSENSSSNPTDTNNIKSLLKIITKTVIYNKKDNNVGLFYNNGKYPCNPKSKYNEQHNYFDRLLLFLQHNITNFIELSYLQDSGGLNINKENEDGIDVV